MEFGFIYDPEDVEWTPILEVLNNLQNLKKIGKLRNFGLSNETAWGISKYLSISEKHNLIRPASVQNGYNLINRVFDISNSEISIRENCGLLAYSPLAGGRLTGKYLNGSQPKEARYTLWPGRFARHKTKRGEVAISKYIEITKKYELKITDLANAFVLSRPFVSSSIFGVTKLNQLKENINCLNLVLSEELMKEIEQIHIDDPNPCV